MDIRVTTDKITNSHTLRLLEACRVEPKPYVPRFDWIEHDGGYWIRDHGKPIAYIRSNWLLLDAFEFSPFTSLGRDLTIHPRYDMGTYINMHAMLLPAVGGNFRWPSERCALTWNLDDPSVLVFTVEADYKSGERSTNTLTLSYDPETAQYCYRIHKVLALPEPGRKEFCNIYPKHLGNGMPSGAKWQYTLWSGADGRLWKMPVNPAFTCAIRASDPARNKLLAHQGFIGWGVQEDFNLVTVIEHSSVPVVSATCDMWFDEHLTFEAAGMEQMRDGTRVDMEVTFRLLNVPPSPLREFIDAAEQVPVSQEEIERFGVPGFIFGQVNDLEGPMDPTLPQPGQIWPLDDSKSGLFEVEDGGRAIRGSTPLTDHVAWVKDEGHSGNRSIRVNGFPHKIVRLTPGGQAVHVKPGATYRFEGWIKSEGALGRLFIGRIWYTAAAYFGHAVSASVGPSDDWTHVAVELSSEDLPYLICQLEVEGDGFAWFDDLNWYEVNP